jgi:glutamine amidotransferase
VSITVGIVTLGAANRRSIEAALLRAGATTRFIDEPFSVGTCDALVLPGVANFGYVAQELDRTGMRSALIEAITFGVPLLGICVGFQLLFERSDEAPSARGLGIFAGSVRLLHTPCVPHMGWNLVDPLRATATIRLPVLPHAATSLASSSTPNGAAHMARNF